MKTSDRSLTWLVLLVACAHCTPLPAQNQEVPTIDIARRLTALEQRIEVLESSSQSVEQRELEQQVEAITRRLDDDQLEVTFSDGFTAASRSGFRLVMGGRIHTDFAFLARDEALESSLGHFNDGAEFRRARLEMDGVLYRRIGFRAQYEFAGGGVRFRSLYGELREVPIVGRIRIGQQREPFGLERQTSTKFTSFLERALPTALMPGRSTGISFHNDFLDDRLSISVGAFRASSSSGDSSPTDDSGGAVTLRVSGRPIAGGDLFDEPLTVHLGTSASFRNPTEHQIRLFSRPEIHFAPIVLDTTTIPANEIQSYGADILMIAGPLSIQAEVVTSRVEGPDGTAHPFGFYAFASYFLTGETRRMRADRLARVIPERNAFDGTGGIGAVEALIRYSHLDLDVDGLNGGESDAWTIGLTWYLNPNTRVLFNWVIADIAPNDSDRGTAHLFAVRFAIDF